MIARSFCRVVGVVGAVDGGDGELAGGVDPLGQRDRGVLDGGGDAQADVGHHIAGDQGPLGEALGGEVAAGDLGGGQQEVCGVVGEDAVVLLGHAAVEGAQPGFEVGDLEVHLHCGEGAGEGGVGVAVDEGPVRLVLLEDLVHPGEHRAGLAAVGAGTDGEVHVRCRDPQVREEDVAHRGVVVLSGVDDDVLDVVPLRGGIRDRGELDELWARTHDGQDLHASLLLQRSIATPAVYGLQMPSLPSAVQSRAPILSAVPRPNLLVISLSPIHRDARVLRQLSVVAEFGHVTTVGFGPRPEGADEHFQVPDGLSTLPQTPLGIAKLGLRRLRAAELDAPASQWVLTAL